MGATGWHYTTPYDPEPEVALQRVREETIAAGDYLPPGGIIRFPRWSDLPPDVPWKLRLTMVVASSIFNRRAVGVAGAESFRRPGSC